MALLTGRFCSLSNKACSSASLRGADPACTSAAFAATATSACGSPEREKPGRRSCPRRRGLSPYLESLLTRLTQDKELRVPHEGQSGLQELMLDLAFLCQE